MFKIWEERKYAMFGINGLLYIPNYITPEQHQQLAETIDALPWRLDLARRTQQYGYLYEHKAKTADLSARLGDLPEWLGGLAAQLRHDGLVQDLPDQAIINEYEPGQGIGPHIDAPETWGEVVISLSLLSPAMMDLRRGEQKVSLLLEPRSLLALRGEARHDWTHGIARRRADIIDGAVVLRCCRVSVTLRQAKLITDQTKEEKYGIH